MVQTNGLRTNVGGARSCPRMITAYQQKIDNKILKSDAGVMSGDHREAADLREARDRLMQAGAGDLPRPPWSRADLPPDDMTLIRFALWRANSSALGRADLKPALRLLGSAQADMEALESALLFIARAEGLTWAEIAEQLGMRSPQAAQQRFERVNSRLAKDHQ